MQNYDQILEEIKNWIWSAPLLILLIGTGVYLSILLRGIQFRYLGYAIKQVFTPQKNLSEGDISQYQALMTSLAGAIGTGTMVIPDLIALLALSGVIAAETRLFLNIVKKEQKDNR
jgi:alanine or glycine:cation symporter, AGCS family